MIITLIKHEVRRTLKWYATIVAGAALIVGLAALMARLLSAPLDGFFNLLAAFAAVAVGAAIPIWLGIDFYRSSYSKTGYLTRALPVKGTTIYWVKLLYAYALSLIAIVVALALTYVAAIGFSRSAGMSVAEMNAAIGEALRVIGAFPNWAIALMLVLAVLWPFVWLASYYFAATVGSEAWAHKLGVGGPVVVWFIFYAATQIVGLLGIFIPLQLEIGADTLQFSVRMIQFSDLSGESTLPMGVFITMFALTAVAIGWAAVSFDRKAELR